MKVTKVMKMFFDSNEEYKEKFDSAVTEADVTGTATVETPNGESNLSLNKVNDTTIEVTDPSNPEEVTLVQDGETPGQKILTAKEEIMDDNPDNEPENHDDTDPDAETEHFSFDSLKFHEENRESLYFSKEELGDMSTLYFSAEDMEDPSTLYFDDVLPDKIDKEDKEDKGDEDKKPKEDSEDKSKDDRKESEDKPKEEPKEDKEDSEDKPKEDKPKAEPKKESDDKPEEDSRSKDDDKPKDEKEHCGDSEYKSPVEMAREENTKEDTLINFCRNQNSKYGRRY